MGFDVGIFVNNNNVGYLFFYFNIVILQFVGGDIKMEDVGKL